MHNTCLYRRNLMGDVQYRHLSFDTNIIIDFYFIASRWLKYYPWVSLERFGLLFLPRKWEIKRFWALFGSHKHQTNLCYRRDMIWYYVIWIIIGMSSHAWQTVSILIENEACQCWSSFPPFRSQWFCFIIPFYVLSNSTARQLDNSC